MIAGQTCSKQGFVLSRRLLAFALPLLVGIAIYGWSAWPIPDPDDDEVPGRARPGGALPPVYGGGDYAHVRGSFFFCSS